jgi:hypothetical protein
MERSTLLIMTLYVQLIATISLRANEPMHNNNLTSTGCRVDDFFQEWTRVFAAGLRIIEKVEQLTLNRVTSGYIVTLVALRHSVFCLKLASLLLSENKSTAGANFAGHLTVPVHVYSMRL